MEDLNEDEGQTQSLLPHLPRTFVFGFGLGFLLFFQSQTFSGAVKLADGALKASKVLPKLRSPSSPHSLVAASKVLIEACILSSRINPVKDNPRAIPPVASKRIKAYIGAANLVRYARNGFVGLGLLDCGYKVSKNLAKLLEGFGGLELDSAVRGGLKSFALLVKAAIVAEDVERRISISRRRRRNHCRFVRAFGWRYEVCSSSKRSDFGYLRGTPAYSLDLCEQALGGSGKHVDARLSELLSLSIPVTCS